VSRAHEVSIWQIEFEKGLLPQVCVRSGENADRTLKFRFGEFNYGTGRMLLSIPFGIFAFLGGPQADGKLPLTNRWRVTFLALRWVALATFPLGIFVLLTAGAWPQQIGATIVATGLGLLVVYAISHLAYAALRPKGTVYRSSFGPAWIHLRDVHPNFVSAVETMEAEALASRGFSPDGYWFWDGSQWVSAHSPDGRWKWDGIGWRPSSSKRDQASAPTRAAESTPDRSAEAGID
jgi:hypothetical protein